MTSHGRDNLPIREAAIPYLINMYSLEMGAGWSFQRARIFLKEQGLLYHRLEIKLREAHRQEIEHAGLIHRMLTHVQIPFLLNKATLNRRARDFEKTFLTGWDRKDAAYAGILYNRFLEQHVIDEGLDTFVKNMKHLGGILQSERILTLAEVYNQLVGKHELEHVALDEETLTALRMAYPAAHREAIEEGMQVPIFQTSLSGFIRTRKRLEKLMEAHG